MYLRIISLILFFLCQPLWSNVNKDQSTVSLNICKQQDKKSYQLNLENGTHLNGKTFTLTIFDPAKTENSKMIVTVKDGEIWNKDTNQKLLVDFENVRPGYMILFRLVNNKLNVCLESSVIPNPLEFHCDDGGFLTLSYLGSDIYVLKGHNFKANEPLKMISKSGTESIRNTFEASKDGSFFATIAPARVGHDCGDASLILIRNEGKKIEINYRWGEPGKFKLSEEIEKGFDFLTIN